jgi:hypothetical protein
MTKTSSSLWVAVVVCASVAAGAQYRAVVDEPVPVLPSHAYIVLTPANAEPVSIPVLPSADLDAVGLCVALERAVPLRDWIDTIQHVATQEFALDAQPAAFQLSRQALFAALHEHYGGSVHALHEAALRLSGTIRQGIRELGILFGSEKHLRVQHARLGVFSGVPVVHFAHEASVSAYLANLGEWESLQTELLQVIPHRRQLEWPIHP